MSDDERPLIDEILDYAVYAPIGLAITVLEDLPGLVNRGKSKLGPQIGIARFAGKMAFRQVRRSVEDLLRPSTPSEEPPPEANEILDLTGTEGVVIEARGHVAETPTPPAPVPAPAPELAIPAYDTLAASQIVARLNGLNAEELRSVRLYEESHRARRTILARITQLEQADDADEGSHLVRVAEERDRTELRALLGVASDEVAEMRGNALRLASLPRDIDQLVAHLLADSSTTTLVADRAEGLCGFALVSYDPPQLFAIYVATDQRRQGVARALIAAAQELSAKRGSGTLTTVAAAGDRAEKSLYEALGYRAELLVMAPRVRPVVVDQRDE